MNCFAHPTIPSVGLCGICQKAVCRECIAQQEPRLLCQSCRRRSALFGFEYKSQATFAGWPLLHICLGRDVATLRPKVARGIVAIGNVAVGVVAIGGLSVGAIAFGGLAVGVVVALGGLAIGTGISFGGLSIGSIAVGGAAIGVRYALGGLAIAPAAIDGRGCSEAALGFFRQWFSVLPPHCR